MLHNPTSVLAFDFLKVNRETSRRVSREEQVDPEILPVLWQGNYFSSLPGETRQITARYHIKKESGTTPSVELEGWNVNPMVVQANP